MSVEQIKKEITVLTAPEQDEVTAFLFHIRHRADPDYQSAVTAKLADKDMSNWLTPEEFERRLDLK